MPDKILILGGTTEAVDLAESLVAQGHDVTTSLAGRTVSPEVPDGNFRSGGFGGWLGLTKFLEENKFTRLIDATHPFATTISKNAVKAARKTGIPLESVQRSPWQRKAGDNWLEASSLSEASRILPSGARAFLAIGSQHLSAFAERNDVEFVVRMIDAPKSSSLPENYEIVLGKPPIDSATEIILFESHRITHLLCRNSGGDRSYAKVEAARKLGLPVIMISRPAD